MIKQAYEQNMLKPVVIGDAPRLTVSNNLFLAPWPGWATRPSA